MGSFGKDLLAVTKSRGTVIVCGVLTSMITARYLGPEGSGVLAALTVYPDLFMVVGSLGIRQAATFYIGQKKFPDSETVTAVACLWIISSIICVAACYFLLTRSIQQSFDGSLLALALLPLPFSLFSTYASGVFLGKNKIKEFNAVNWVPYVVRFVAYLLLILMASMNVFGAVLGIALGYIIVSFFVWKKLKKIIQWRWQRNSPLIFKMLKLGLVYALSLMVINLNYKIDIVLLDQLSTKSEVGLYTKGVSVVEYLWEVPTLLSTIVFARSATATDPGAFSDKVAQLLRICFVVVLMMCVVFYFLSETIMVLLYGEAFRASAGVQQLLLPGILLLTIFKVLNMDLAGKGKPWVAVIAMLPALVINFVLNYMLDATYGAKGAAIASAISYSVSALLFLILYSRIVKRSVGKIVRIRYSDFNFIKEWITKHNPA